MLQNLDNCSFVCYLVGNEGLYVARFDVDAIESAHWHIDNILSVEADAQQIIV